MSKLFDLRFVIGAFFFVIGFMLLVHGFMTADQSARTVNRWCGGTFLVFGIVMVVLSLRKDADDELLPDE